MYDGKGVAGHFVFGKLYSNIVFINGSRISFMYGKFLFRRTRKIQILLELKISNVLYDIFLEYFFILAHFKGCTTSLANNKKIFWLMIAINQVSYYFVHQFFCIGPCNNSPLADEVSDLFCSGSNF